MHRFYSDPEVTRYLDWVSHSVENSRFFIRWFKEGYRKKNALRWGVTPRDGDQVIGTIGYHDFYLHSRAELSYELTRSRWNQGIVSEALEVVIPFGFQALNLHRIQAWTFPENSTSIHLLQKFRFQEEGLMREYVHLWHKKTWADVRMFARLRSD
ncbi:MAG: GNAT family N-acetyltransferase [Firmicutes bacterium]|nr:GNAT family N-acetyltransferase [Bacillota bacterium]